MSFEVQISSEIAAKMLAWPTTWETEEATEAEAISKADRNDARHPASFGGDYYP